MYLDRAEEEDRRVAERWKGDADGILVFVRFSKTGSHDAGLTHYITDGSVLSHGRQLSCRNLPKSPAQPTSNLDFLSRKHLPGSCRCQWVANDHFPPPSTQSINF